MKNDKKLERFPSLQTLYEQTQFNVKNHRKTSNSSTEQQKFIADIYYLPYSKSKTQHKGQQRSDAVYFLTQCVKQKDFLLPKNLINGELPKVQQQPQPLKKFSQRQSQQFYVNQQSEIKKLSPINKNKDVFFDFDLVGQIPQQKQVPRIVEKRTFKEIYEEEFEIKTPTEIEKLQLKQHLNLPIAPKLKKHGSQLKYFNSQIIHRNTVRKSQIFQKVKSIGNIYLRQDNTKESVQNEKDRSPRNKLLKQKSQEKNITFPPRSRNRLISSELLDPTQYYTMTSDEVQDYYMQLKNQGNRKSFNFKLNPLRTNDNFRINNFKYPQDQIKEEQEYQDSFSQFN